jgi:uncharacterized membrane protein YdbT with pleckstrin-like domain
MASYIEGSPFNGEKVLYTGKISKWAISGFYTFGTLFGLMALLLIFQPASRTMGVGLAAASAVLFFGASIKLKTTELAITNKRVFAKFGFVSRQTVELNISKVESIQVHQGILGRMFNYGSLVISGAGTPQAPIPGISNPLAFRTAFMEAQDAAAQK